MNATRTVLLEPDNRIQLPADWTAALGLQGQVLLDKTPEGILIRPRPQSTWAEFFATGLTIGSASPGPSEDDVEVTGDDLLF